MKNELKNLKEEGYKWLSNINFTNKEIYYYKNLVDKKLNDSEDPTDENVLKNAKSVLHHYQHYVINDLYNTINEHLNKIDQNLNKALSNESFEQKYQNHQWISNRIFALEHKISCVKAMVYF